MDKKLQELLDESSSDFDDSIDQQKILSQIRAVKRDSLLKSDEEEEANGDEGDDWGNFGEVENQQKEEEAAGDAEDDGFGDFGQFGEEPSKDDTPAQEEKDEWGEFGEFDGANPEEEKPEDKKSSPEKETKPSEKPVEKPTEKTPEKAKESPQFNSAKDSKDSAHASSDEIPNEEAHKPCEKEKNTNEKEEDFHQQDPVQPSDQKSVEEPAALQGEEKEAKDAQENTEPSKVLEEDKQHDQAQQDHDEAELSEGIPEANHQEDAGQPGEEEDWGAFDEPHQQDEAEKPGEEAGVAEEEWGDFGASAEHPSDPDHQELNDFGFEDEEKSKKEVKESEETQPATQEEGNSKDKFKEAKEDKASNSEEPQLDKPDTAIEDFDEEAGKKSDRSKEKKVEEAKLKSASPKRAQEEAKETVEEPFEAQKDSSEEETGHPEETSLAEKEASAEKDGVSVEDGSKQEKDESSLEPQLKIAEEKAENVVEEEIMEKEAEEEERKRNREMHEDVQDAEKGVSGEEKKSENQSEQKEVSNDEPRGGKQQLHDLEQRDEQKPEATAEFKEDQPVESKPEATPEEGFDEFEEDQPVESKPEATPEEGFAEFEEDQPVESKPEATPEEGFAEFGEDQPAEPHSSIQVEEQEENTNQASQEGFDNFDDQPHEEPSKSDNSLQDDFGDFDQAEPQTQPEEKKDPVVDDDEDDGFGDFGDDNDQPQLEEQAAEDDFDDFEEEPHTAPPAQPPASALPTQGKEALLASSSQLFQALLGVHPVSNEENAAVGSDSGEEDTPHNFDYLGTAADYSQMIDFSQVEGQFKAAPKPEGLSQILKDMKYGIQDLFKTKEGGKTLEKVKLHKPSYMDNAADVDEDQEQDLLDFDINAVVAPKDSAEQKDSKKDKAADFSLGNLRLKVINQELNTQQQLEGLRDSTLSQLVSEQSLANYHKSKIRNQIKVQQIQNQDGLNMDGDEGGDIEFMLQTQATMTQQMQRQESIKEETAFNDDLLAMDFNQQESPSLAKEVSESAAQQAQEDQNQRLAEAFAEFGVTLEPVGQKAEAENQSDQGGDSEGEKDFSVPLPNFNTVPIKVRRLVDSLPDYEYLFE